MCGFIGVYTSKIDVRRDDISNSLKRINHRGPDSEGIVKKKNFSIGFKRLSILDVSDGANQPFQLDNRYLLVFNGEIYNYKEISETYLNNHNFVTNSDTEILYKVLILHGENILVKLNGMFSFAFIDFTENTLLFARDRFGKKPLYIYEDDKSIVWASEIKSIICLPFVKKEMDNDAISQFLQLQYIQNPMTGFKNIRKFKQATYEKYKDAKCIEAKYYWNYTISKRSKSASLDELLEEFDCLINDSVKLRLISDVPLGCFLSGGIDSSIIAFLSQKFSMKKIKTFSIGFSEDRETYDETKMAEDFSSYIGSNHFSKYIDYTYNSKYLEKCIWHTDEPIAETLLTPFFALTEFAQNEITVALGGDGPDEFLGGYRYYCLAKFPFSSLFENRFANNYFKKKLAVSDNVLNLRSRVLKTLTSESAYNKYYNWYSFFTNTEIAELMNVSFTSPVKNSASVIADKMNNFEEIMVLDQQNRMIDYILNSRDKLSMANSLELRSPFLDYRIVEFFLGLNENYKIRNGTHKYFLREYAKRYIKHDVVNRRKKPFAAPINKWTNEYKDQFSTEFKLCKDSILNETKVKNYFKTDMGKMIFPGKAWNLIILELWYKNYF